MPRRANGWHFSSDLSSSDTRCVASMFCPLRSADLMAAQYCASILRNRFQMCGGLVLAPGGGLPGIDGWATHSFIASGLISSWIHIASSAFLIVERQVNVSKSCLTTWIRTFPRGILANVASPVSRVELCLDRCSSLKSPHRTVTSALTTIWFVFLSSVLTIRVAVSAFLEESASFGVNSWDTDAKSADDARTTGRRMLFTMGTSRHARIVEKMRRSVRVCFCHFGWS